MAFSIKDAKPMSQLSDNSGAKVLLYGPPGSGKTPSVIAAPRPIVCLTEAGALSVKNNPLASKIPGVPLFSPQAIRDFFAWFKSSTEVRHFDTIIIDSFSQLAEILVKEYLGGKSKSGAKVDGKAAYGDMARECMEYAEAMHYRMGINIICIAKQGVFQEMGTDFTKPVFPGKDLNVRMPHLFDEIIHIGQHPECSVVDKSTLQCRASFNILARDRSDTLAQYEHADFASLFQKIKAGIPLTPA